MHVDVICGTVRSGYKNKTYVLNQGDGFEHLG